jgi:hypothetical protein
MKFTFLLLINPCSLLLIAHSPLPTPLPAPHRTIAPMMAKRRKQQIALEGQHLGVVMACLHELYRKRNVARYFDGVLYRGRVTEREGEGGLRKAGAQFPTNWTHTHSK